MGLSLCKQSSPGTYSSKPKEWRWIPYMTGLLQSEQPAYESTADPVTQAAAERTVDNQSPSLLSDEEHGHYDTEERQNQRAVYRNVPWHRRPSPYVVSFATFLFSLSFAASASTRQVLQVKLACNSLSTPDTTCDPKDAQVLVSDLHIFYVVASCSIMFMATGHFVPLSDKYGRKVFLVLMVAFALAGEGIRYFVLSHWNTLKFKLLILSEAVGNLGGGFLGFTSVANCYITDVVDPRDRRYYFGFVLSAVYVGVTLGPLASNWLISIGQSLGSAAHLTVISDYEYWPLKFELAALTLLLFVVVFALPESVAKKPNQDPSRTQQPPAGNRLYKAWNRVNFLKPLKILVLPKEYIKSDLPAEIRRIQRSIIIMVLIDCLVIGMSNIIVEVVILYSIYTFGYRQQKVGQLMAVLFSSKAMGLIVLSPLVSKYFLQHRLKYTASKQKMDAIDFTMVLLGAISELVGLTGLYYSRSSSMLLVSIMLTSFDPFIAPTLTSTLSKYYPESKIGELFGAVALLKNASGILCSFVFLSAYKYSLSALERPALTFLLFGAAYVLVLISITYVKYSLGIQSRIHI